MSRLPISYSSEAFVTSHTYKTNKNKLATRMKKRNILNLLKYTRGSYRKHWEIVESVLEEQRKKKKNRKRIELVMETEGTGTIRLFLSMWNSYAAGLVPVTCFASPKN